MDVIVEAIVTNAVLATGVAATVAVLCRFVRQPGIARFLWLLVLLRLAVPPLIGIRVPVVVSMPVTGRAEHGEGDIVASPGCRSSEIPSTSPSSTPLTVAQLPQAATPRQNLSKPVAVVPKANWTWRNWRTLLFAIWATGTVIWCSVAVGRLRRFSRWLRHARPASERLVTQAGGIAEQLGLRSCPDLLVVTGRLAPSLWALGGRACVLLPKDLLKKLDSDQLDMLLAHELAHYRRRDHWCRWFEALILAVYWWHPVAWWARSCLVRAEEECCDTRVLWTFPARARTYAETLLTTVEFLMPSPVTAPVSTGISVFPLLKRRLEMILHDRPRHRMTPFTLFVLALFAVATLSLSPTLRAEKPESPPSPRAAAITPEEAVKESAVPEEFDREHSDALNAAFEDLREKQIALQRSKQKLLTVVEQLQGPGKSTPARGELTEFEKRQQVANDCFARALAATEELNGRKAVLYALDLGKDFGDSTNLYLNAIQRKAEAEYEYMVSLAAQIDVSDLGPAVERQKQQWLALRRLDTAISGRDATLQTWKWLKARRTAGKKNAMIQCESQARTQYWAFHELVAKCQKEYFLGI